MTMTRTTLTAVAAGLVISAQVASADNGEAMGFGFHGIGGQLGFISPEDPIDSSFIFGVQALLGTFSSQVPQLLFVPSITYWSKSYDVGTRSDAKFSELGFSGDARWMFTKEGAAPDAVQFFASGGLGFYRGKAEVTTRGFRHRVRGHRGRDVLELGDRHRDQDRRGRPEALRREASTASAEVTYKIGDIDSFRICVGGTWDTSN